MNAGSPSAADGVMRALVVRAHAPFRCGIETVPRPVPGPAEVRLRVLAAGVSFVDVLTARGDYQSRPGLPFVPGSECAGVVDAVGAGVTGVRPGDRVCALAWGGVFADYLCVPRAAVMPLPAGADPAEGAVIRVASTTALHALADRGRLAAGETLLVLGAAGSVGQAAIQVGKALGATVVAAARGAAKREAALAAGADRAVEGAAGSLRADLRGRLGIETVDMVFDPVGGELSEAAFRLLGWQGRHLVVGFASGAIPAIRTNLALLKGASLVGVNVGRLEAIDPAAAAANLRRVRALWRAGAIRPRIGHRLPFARHAEAFALASGGQADGRVVLDVAGA